MRRIRSLVLSIDGASTGGEQRIPAISDCACLSVAEDEEDAAKERKRERERKLEVMRNGR